MSLDFPRKPNYNSHMKSMSNNDELLKGRRERKRVRTRADILAAARQVFARRGYHEASIAEITERADVGVGTFYHYFTNKDEVFKTVMEDALRETVELVRQSLATETSKQSLHLVVHSIFRHAYHKRELFRVAMLSGPEFTRISRVQDAIEEVLLTFLEEALSLEEQMV